MRKPIGEVSRSDRPPLRQHVAHHIEDRCVAAPLGGGSPTCARKRQLHSRVIPQGSLVPGEESPVEIRERAVLYRGEGASLAEIAHPVHVGRPGHVRLRAHVIPDGECAHPQHVRLHHPLLRVHVGDPEPVRQLPWIHIEHHRNRAQHYQARDVVAPFIPPHIRVPEPSALQRLQHDERLPEFLCPLDRSLEGEVPARPARSGHPIENAVAARPDQRLIRAPGANRRSVAHRAFPYGRHRRAEEQNRYLVPAPPPTCPPAS